MIRTPKTKSIQPICLPPQTNGNEIYKKLNYVMITICINHKFAFDYASSHPPKGRAVILSTTLRVQSVSQSVGGCNIIANTEFFIQAAVGWMVGWLDIHPKLLVMVQNRCVFVHEWRMARRNSTRRPWKCWLGYQNYYCCQTKDPTERIVLCSLTSLF